MHTIFWQSINSLRFFDILLTFLRSEPCWRIEAMTWCFQPHALALVAPLTRTVSAFRGAHSDTPTSLTAPKKMMLGRLLSVWKGNFSAASYVGLWDCNNPSKVCSWFVQYTGSENCLLSRLTPVTTWGNCSRLKYVAPIGSTFFGHITITLLVSVHPFQPQPRTKTGRSSFWI